MSKKDGVEDSESIMLNGVKYVREQPVADDKYVIVRSVGAGVHAGELVSRTGQEVELRQARRVWYWKGAMSLSDLSLNGVATPAECKFGPPISITVLGVVEIIPCSKKARESIQGVKEWKQ